MAHIETGMIYAYARYGPRSRTSVSQICGMEIAGGYGPTNVGIRIARQDIPDMRQGGG